MASPPADPLEPDDSPPRSRVAGAWETVRFCFVLAMIALLFRSLVLVPFSIPSESMLPRLLVGDYLLVAKWPYGWSRYSFPFSPPLFDGRILARAPERGDVVVFKAPPDQRQDYIKRLIGLPGDLVQVRHGQLILNGNPVPRVRVADFVTPLTANTECKLAGTPRAGETIGPGLGQCRFPRYRETLPGGRSYEVIDQTDTPQDDTAVFVVPAAHYFMMGDNRDMSADSRFPAVPGGGIGFVPADNVEGRALVSFFSTDGSARWLEPWTWWQAARPERIGEGFR